ncbi:MAG: hypothetical protein BV457_05980 [Thermoplasmata archaeon M9B1D]|nr:MAG: hypothetical protein BV457_05980 [Thermoplasmata archaeon M9B1D]
MLSCIIGDNRINLLNDKYDNIQLKKWASKNILICPACGKPYEYCHGKIKIPYFRHKDKQECLDIYSESETQEHLQGKKDLYEWLIKQDGVSNVILEGWLPKTKQRPDIMFIFNGKQHVIEYQCTPISSEYYERHELYKASGIIDIWICGAKNYFQEYHKGNGNKRLNILEKETRKYYNTVTRELFFLDKDINIDDKKFNSEKIDLKRIKNIDLSYSNNSYFKSRRKGWVTEYTYKCNNSFAKYAKIDNFKLERMK